MEEISLYRMTSWYGNPVLVTIVLRQEAVDSPHKEPVMRNFVVFFDAWKTVVQSVELLGICDGHVMSLWRMSIDSAVIHFHFALFGRLIDYSLDG